MLEGVDFARQSEAATYGGHGNAATEATADTVVDTLGLSPAGVEALEAIGLVAEEARSACESMLMSARRGRAPVFASLGLSSSSNR